MLPRGQTEQMERLREESQREARDASASQNDELKKAQDDLAKAKKEVHALRKQRDAKLAVHERQACAFYPSRCRLLQLYH